ncbi:hypothetical protein AGRA3207_002211 [Actinomadura graeca]|uniref:DUF6879 domain-containing protein n=2 Tax=Actinomadura graeca TaxID=2750812 RepID=A0ABX8R5T1_9ACTN|nr:hypothetical protein AGRA3207_002211 [Actinomadura graeca]
MDEVSRRLSFDEWVSLFGSATRSLAHLEMRDGYLVDYEDERYKEWVAGGRTGVLPREDHPWWNLTADTVARGVSIRRARIISEPVSEYIAFEHAGTWQNVEFGEQVRWLPRGRASAIALPGNDFWLIDASRVLFLLFDGTGRPIGRQLSADDDVVALCSTAFEQVWRLGTDHAEHRLRSC